MNTAQLQEIKEEEQAVDDVVVNKILSALKDGAKLRRQLARLTHLKVVTIDLVIRSLEAQDKVKVVTVSNPHGEPSCWITLNTVTNEEKKMKLRLIRMAVLGL